MHYDDGIHVLDIYQTGLLTATPSEDCRDILAAWKFMLINI